ncbi:MAG: VanZ family protein [Syntrophobacterales bacterium]|nr:VanZ family protein [Syntrophobacterales bacterium]
MAWCAAILIFSGDLGSSRKTLGLFYWLMSWFPQLTPQEVEAWHAWFRKLGHLSAYAVLYLLFFRAAHLHLGLAPGRTCLVALVLTLGVAGVDETRQSLHPARSGTPADVGRDMLGALMAAIVIPGLWRPGRGGRLGQG